MNSDREIIEKIELQKIASDFNERNDGWQISLDETPQGLLQALEDAQDYLKADLKVITAHKMRQNKLFDTIGNIIGISITLGTSSTLIDSILALSDMQRNLVSLLVSTIVGGGISILIGLYVKFIVIENLKSLPVSRWQDLKRERKCQSTAVNRLNNQLERFRIGRRIRFLQQENKPTRFDSIQLNYYQRRYERLNGLIK